MRAILAILVAGLGLAFLGFYLLLASGLCEGNSADCPDDEALGGVLLVVGVGLVLLAGALVIDDLWTRWSRLRRERQGSRLREGASELGEDRQVRAEPHPGDAADAERR